ncbi:hypothetical protein [Serratia marcescens]|uniref:hypothetical protein n=2 Tax=Serratia marcescens TaxID=615 RepID=UPI00077E0E36|nr:hypothetical protein [Serratia marcescens]MDP8632233.1 hypothetical protein [Serratia marcescens]MDP8751054.1 hypothetical protein [Serratia marcescens]MDP8765372.1 hypothetical protein [Serratia marcescens]
MFHLDNTSGVPEMPEPKEAQSSTPRWFGESVQQGGISWPGADWFNIVQAELLELMKLGEEAPDKLKFNQIASAIKYQLSQVQASFSGADGFEKIGALQTNLSRVMQVHIRMFGAHDVTEPGFENFDSAPALQAAINYAQANNIKTVNVTGNYKLLSAQGGFYTLPRDDGRISEHFAARGEVPIDPEPVITMPVCISLPSDMCLKSDTTSDSSLYGPWNRANGPIDTGQMIGICLRHRGWPKNNDRLTAYVQEVKTSNVKLGGFILGLVSDGVVYSKCQFNNLTVQNCGIPIIFQGCDNVQFTGSTELVTNMAAMVIGGQWLQRENTWVGGKWSPPYTENRNPDIASIGWCDMLSIHRLSCSYGGQPFTDRHLEIDKFFNDFFYKSFNNISRLTKTNTDGNPSDLDKVEPYRGVAHRAFVNLSRYARGNANVHIYEVKVFGSARTPFFSPHTQGTDYYGTVHAGFYENVGSWDAGKYSVETDHYAKGNDVYNADRHLIKFGVVEGVMGIGRTTYANSVQCLPAEKQRVSFDRRGTIINARDISELDIFQGDGITSDKLLRSLAVWTGNKQWGEIERVYLGRHELQPVTWNREDADQTHLFRHRIGYDTLGLYHLESRIADVQGSWIYMSGRVRVFLSFIVPSDAASRPGDMSIRWIPQTLRTANFGDSDMTINVVETHIVGIDVDKWPVKDTAGNVIGRQEHPKVLMGARGSDQKLRLYSNPDRTNYITLPDMKPGSLFKFSIEYNAPWKLY